MTLARTPPASSDDHVFLIGRPPLSEFISFIKVMAIDGQSANQGKLAAEWRSANDHVKRLETNEAGIADSQTIGSLDPSVSQLAETFLKNPFFLRSFSLVPVSL